jgi:glycosyltransferase involved in cell wall biosynthesis
VQRVTKFVKYLPQWGWLPSVLTVANPSVPLRDDSLLGDIPRDTIIRRARTWEPSYALKTTVSSDGDATDRTWSTRNFAKATLRRFSTFILQPDPNILWLPDAIRKGNRLLAEIPHQAVVATGPPFSAFLIGAALSRRHRVPLVLDYRDEWDLSSAYWENKRSDPLSRFIQSWMQRRVVRAAKALIGTTQSSARALDSVRERTGSRARVSWIYNGFDPDDFPASNPTPQAVNGHFRIAYVGTLWNLTSAAPLAEAVRRLAERQPTLASRLELIFAGRRTGGQQQNIDKLKSLPCRLVEKPYLEHADAVELLGSADGLCVLLSDLPGIERVVPAKIFECMAAKRPIWAIAPRGEVWDLLEDYPCRFRFLPQDIDGIRACLEEQIQLHCCYHTVPQLNWNSSRYERKTQAKYLAELLDSLHVQR